MGDIPGNMKIVVNGPGKNDFVESANDVVCCVKRYASDKGLSQDRQAIQNVFASFPFVWQEPLLVFPAEYMELLGDVPQVPRPLKTFDTDRRKKLVLLANLILSNENTESAARTVRYLLDLTTPNPVPDPVPPLRWLSTRSHGEFDALINLDVGGSAVGRIIPQMQFTARMNRRRDV